MNVLGDIAGQFETLEALVKKLPSGEIMSVGDMVDRGPDSKLVLDFFMDHKALLGNHEHLMLDAFEISENLLKHGANKTNYKNILIEKNISSYYQPGLWFQNGGYHTLMSFDKNAVAILDGQVLNSIELLIELSQIIPRKYYDYLKSLPLYLETDKFLITHAPKFKRHSVEEATDLGTGFHTKRDHKSDYSILWNRDHVGPYKNKIQIFGHNAYKKIRFFNEKFPQGISHDNVLAPAISEIYAIGIDTSASQTISAINLDTLKIYQEKYIY